MISRAATFYSKAKRRLHAKMPWSAALSATRNQLSAANEEMSRLGGLYDSMVSRTALLEQKIGSVGLLEERVRTLGTDNAKLTEMCAQRIEQQLKHLTESSSEIDSLWGAFRADLLKFIGHGNFDGNPTLPSMLDRVRSLGDQFAERHRLVNTEFASLRQENEELRTKLEHLTRSNRKHVPFPRLTAEPASYLPLHVVDVGSQPLTSEDHVYAALKGAGTCRVTGFEALPDKSEPGDPNLRTLNLFVGTGAPATFHVAKFDPTSSLIEPNLPFLRQFMSLAEMCKPVSTYPVQTTRLDDIPEISDCDFLKLDVQGGELDVLRGADRLLESTIVVHTEVEFAPVYLDQPLFSDVDTHLRSKGFELMDLIKFGHNTYADLPSMRTASRLLWSDAIYFRNIETLSELGAQKLLRAAYIAHVNYRMWDLAAHILAGYDSKYGSYLALEYVAAIERT